MSNESNKDNYLRKKRKTLLNSRTLSLALFVFAMSFCSLLGIVLPLRPTESALEKRELAKFPEFSLSGMLDGSYFSGISTWYADSFPMRDAWMKGNDLIKDAYGVRTNQVSVASNTGDEIPDIPVRQTQPAPQEQAPAAEPGETMAPVTSEAQTGADMVQEVPPATTEEAIPEVPVFTPLEAQKIDSYCVIGDTIYGMYFFNTQAANTYTATLSRVAAELKGSAKVYSILAPLSEAFYLNDELRKEYEPDWKNEGQAQAYYDASFSEDVVSVPVYDTLMHHRDEYIYFRTDHHWSGLGAYYAYSAWAHEKGIEPHALDEYEEKVFPGFLGSYYSVVKSPEIEANPDTVHAYVPLTCKTMTMHEKDGDILQWNIISDVSNSQAGSKYLCFTGGDNPLSYIENPNVTTGDVCVVIKDSYGNSVIPFLADHYQYLYWFDYRHYTGNIMQFIKEHNVRDVIFITGLEPDSDKTYMERLSDLLK